MIRPDRWLIVALVIVAGFAGGRAWLAEHPQHDPWAPLRLGDPPGWATARKLSALRQDPLECRATLRRSDVAFRALPATGQESCLRSDRVVLQQPAPLAVEATCAVQAGATRWLETTVQPAAREILGSRVTAVEHFGAYSCRRMYGLAEGAWSEHATGNAVDIAAFVLADGRRISIKRHWTAGDKRAQFLHAVRDGACDAFGTVLSPDYNAAHADHLHLDQARSRIGWSVCR